MAQIEDALSQALERRDFLNCHQPNFRIALPAQGAATVGEYVRESLNLTVWGATQERVRGWEASGQVGVIKNDVPGVKEAIEKHIADAQARNLKPESLKKIKDVIERRLGNYCTHQSYRSLLQLDVDAVREFRNELVKDYSANSARKRLEYARSFFNFCHQSGWITANPAAVIKPPKADYSPTMPFEQKHIDAVLKAADEYAPPASSERRPVIVRSPTFR